MNASTDPTSFGRVDAEGNVYVRTSEGEHAVGQWAASSDPQDGLQFYARKYADLRIEMDLSRRRLQEGTATVESIKQTVDRVRAVLAEPNVVGDLLALEVEVGSLETALAAYQMQLQEERKAAREQAYEQRLTLVTEAEGLVKNPSGAGRGRLTEILQEWKTAPHTDRTREQELWHRLSSARNAFDRAWRVRRAELKEQREQATKAKEALIKEAEALSTSTDWNETSRAYRDLMNRWKRAPRAGRREDDALWERFRAAQDVFFNARKATFDQRDSEQVDNLKAKEALAAQAEKLLPIQDLAATKESLREIQEQWEGIGYVPRNDKDRIERRLQKVERAVREAEDREWRRSDPELINRVERTVATFRQALEKAEAELAAARESGDERKVRKLEQSVEQTKMLLAAAEGGLG